MKIAYFDCFSGISGDMTVGALIDAGADLEKIQTALASLRVPGFKVQAQKVIKKGVTATQFKVIEDEKEKHPHRHLPQVIEIIESGALPNSVKQAAIETFKMLGEAEAGVHGLPIDKVHFHEVGAVDSIVDIVAAQYALHLLGVEAVYASPLHVGAGTVKCAHGIMPVPAPATARLLQGIPTYGGDVQGELVTPTGAALLKQSCKNFGGMPQMRVEVLGYGSGEKHLIDRANVVRVSIGEAADAEISNESVIVIECMMDDMNSELYPPMLEVLLANGARDVYITPVLGKKGRPAQQLTVLCDDALLQSTAELIFANSSTIGLRYRREARMVLAREIRSVETPWGAVAVKVAFRGEKVHHAAPEFEACRKVADTAKVACKTVYETALAAAIKGEWIP